MIKLFSYDEASETYGIPKEILLRAVASGQLRAFKNGTNWVRPTEKTLDRWIESQERVQ